MPGKDYKVVSIKQDVVKRIQDRAKKEEVSISKLLDNLLDKSSTSTVKSSTGIVTDKEGLTIDQIKNAVKEVASQRGKETFNGTTYNGLTKEDLRSIKEVVAEAISEAMNTH